MPGLIIIQEKVSKENNQRNANMREVLLSVAFRFQCFCIQFTPLDIKVAISR